MIPKLDDKTLRLVGFSDASFANNRNLSTQLGYIILLTDAHGNCVPVLFNSYNSKRINRSKMEGEVIAFADMSHAMVTHNNKLNRLILRRVPLQFLTDPKCLFDVISKGSRTSEKRLMLDTAAAHEKFRTADVSDIGLVRSEDNLADDLTKAMQRPALRTCIREGRLRVELVKTITGSPRNDEDATDHETMDNSQQLVMMRPARTEVRSHMTGFRPGRNLRAFRRVTMDADTGTRDTRAIHAPKVLARFNAMSLVPRWSGPCTTKAPAANPFRVHDWMDTPQVSRQGLHRRRKQSRRRFSSRFSRCTRERPASCSSCSHRRC